MSVNIFYQAVNKYFFSQCWLRRLTVVSAVLLVCLLAGRPLAAQTAESSALLVAPGDTWRALALRYDTTPTALQALNPARPGALNALQEPAIGSYLLLPAALPRSGRLVRPTGTAPTLAALRWGVPPGELLRATQSHPLYLLPAAPLLLPDAQSTIRDLPTGFRTLELSHPQGQAGEGLALRAQIAPSVTLSLTLHTTTIEPLSFAQFRNPAGDRLVALRGVGAFYPTGTQTLTVAVAGAPLWSQPWLFVPGAWEYQQINFSGAAAEIDAASIAAERARLFAIWSQAAPAPLWSAEFATPISDYVAITSPFGTRRSRDGGVTYPSYHEGVDYAAYAGASVFATAAGRVVVAEPLYVRGGAVIIDHGLGVYSGYYHLSAVLVEPDTLVTAGQPIGEVGTTGLSTGNHLHWDFLVTETWVAADKWAARGMGCWVLEGLGSPCAP